MFNLFKKNNKAANELPAFTPESISDFKDIHKGKRCFIIGNGPSLQMADLERLKNEITFGMNKIYLAFDQTSWRPTYYLAQDIIMVPQFAADIDNCDVNVKFIPNDLKNCFSFSTKKNFFLNHMRSINDGYPIAFSSDCSEVTYEGCTVTYTSLQMAAFMGFSEIYLLGVDMSYSIQNGIDGLEINDVKDYFIDNYIATNEDRYVPTIQYSLNSYATAKQACEALNIKIYNATRGGKLEVFERVNFDNILKEMG